MPLYYFHLYSASGIVPDDEGHEHPDLESARNSALAGIRDILREEIATGEIGLGGRMVIMDEQSRIVLTVPFAEAVRVDPTPH